MIKLSQIKKLRKPLQGASLLTYAAVLTGVHCAPAALVGQESSNPPAPGQTTAPAQHRTIHVDLEHPILPIGSEAPDFSLPGIDGKTHALGEYSKAKVLAIVWESDHCPVSENYEERIRAIYNDYKSKGVQLVAINPNNPSAVSLSELGYTDLTDSFADMKLRAANRHMDWPFLYDGETQALATKYGASATPHIFIFDQSRKLRYEGRIDDNQNLDRVAKHDARNAIDALLEGKEVAETHTAAFGCSTKWLSKATGVEREMTKIKAAPVGLNVATAVDLKKIRANSDTGKIVVVNFWSTNCKDCAAIFHELETTYRMYRQRDFSFITVSTDKPENKEEVMKFLQEQYASSPNMQVDTANLKVVQTAFGAKWKLNESFTVVISPDGKILYQKAGKFDIYEMRRAILANMPDNATYVGQHIFWNLKVPGN
jgi:peroxiredoxin